VSNKKNTKMGAGNNNIKNQNVKCKNTPKG
jgi:hypothetical protein